ncbi:uncharacterized protein LOC110415216 [Herrania umbratica]|uniref:Uncharacterized protein LOC110415216 n=1 Tax=Herrania umbratica TaxID=108875 RepID=A0A6J1A666_9ROSI|nr:uncharacterized protein LOC110415216 [Herrania umbratica]
MVTEPFLHKHFLCYDFYKKQEACCYKCSQQIDGRAYSCENCKFWLHKSCAEQELPPQLSHPLHPQHHLTLFCDDSEKFVCDQCFYISGGYSYSCKGCSFNLDLNCASSSKGQLHQEDYGQRSKIGQRKRIHHFSHEHPLDLFNYRKIGKIEISCSWCEKTLSAGSGMSWGCLELCKNATFFHQSCFRKIPKRVQHPFHPSHSLGLQYKNYSSTCNACKGELEDYPCQNYYCNKCNFWLHVFCIRLLPTLKHNCHEHDLTYFIVTNKEDFKCNLCDGNCNAAAEWSILNPFSWFYGKSDCAFYRCVQCDLNFHLNCIPIPRTTKHRYHRHSLILKDSFKEDDSGEYYCDICEEERNSENHVYCCEKCTYIAHIECAINEGNSKELLPRRHQFIDMKLDLGNTSGMAVEQEEMEQVETRQSHIEYPALSEPAETNGSIHNGQFKRQIQHFSHHHPLSFLEIIEKHEIPCCDACKMGILGPAYVCESDEYYLHQTCAELFQDVQHPLHSQHPLKLLTTCPTDQGRFICDECGDISKGFVYFCWECEFKLDLKCAALTTSQNEGQRLKQTKGYSKKSHFSHEHMLVFTNCRPYFKKFHCNGCNLPIVGAAYCCLACSYILHESCLALPQQMKFQFHPEHPLVAKLTQFFEIFNRCHACGTGFRWTNIRYSCSECSLDLHFSCANSLKWPLKHKSHIHNLYYFGTESQKLFENENISFSCNTCSKTCVGPSYRCLECAINFHLECIPIPQRVKSDCHIHPFTLVDSFVEDDSGEYYCDVCEEEKHSKDHIYFCEECNGLFVAHIECALAKVEEAAREIEACSTKEPDLKKTSIQVESKTSPGRATEEMESREEHS